MIPPDRVAMLVCRKVRSDDASRRCITYLTCAGDPVDYQSFRTANRWPVNRWRKDRSAIASSL
jgi:hypothetical protein